MKQEVKEPILEVRGLKKKFGSNQVLNGVDLTINKGEVQSSDHPDAARVHLSAA